MGLVIIFLALILIAIIGSAVLGTLVHLLWWLLIGLVIGLLGRLLIPEHRRPGMLGTILAGIAGSMIGGVLASALDVGSILEFGIAILVAAGLIGVFSGREASHPA